MAKAMTFEEALKKRTNDGGDIPVEKEFVAKFDEDLGLVFGWGIICEKDGAPYYDSQGDWIPTEVMLDGVSKFMAEGRVAKDMHTGDQIGSIVHSFPLIPDIAKSFGIDSGGTYGWMVAMKPSPEVLKQFKSGERTGFSIGGNCNYRLAEAA